ncbi:fish-egg lectin-like [Spea bombifrons]|uniref:fish-egg lectin-like n=1 Tax=Spea bombifrons TaxID=233779 RepID=UPI00234929A9|nr:fish-egg lectin-like [Spea bombifrons]
MKLFLCLAFLGTGVSAVLQCTVMPGKLKQIDAGNGEVYGVNEKDDIYRWSGDNWVPIPGKLIHVSVGPAGVWGVNRQTFIYKLQDNNWVQVTGLLKQIDAGGEKYLSGVNGLDSIYCLNQEHTMSRSASLPFLFIDGSLKYYSCGPLGCWGVNSNNQIYYRYGVSPSACRGSHWKQVDGSLIMVEVGTDGSVYGVNSAGNVYKREGISAATPTGTSWTQLDFGGAFKHVAYDQGILWLLTEKEDIFKCTVGRRTPA